LSGRVITRENGWKIHCKAATIGRACGTILKIVLLCLAPALVPGDFYFMPQYELTMPDLGIDDQPLTVSSWLVKRGTRVTEDEPVLEVLCGGVTVDLPTESSGILVEKLVNDDEIIKIGQLLAIINALD
jgi:multidrug efflux pump subunit AcrA (membrane-fusion protein)